MSMREGIDPFLMLVVEEEELEKCAVLRSKG